MKTEESPRVVRILRPRQPGRKAGRASEPISNSLVKRVRGDLAAVKGIGAAARSFTASRIVATSFPPFPPSTFRGEEEKNKVV